MNFNAAINGLEQSTTGVVALDEESEAIGMGRIVGDGAIYFYIQDISLLKRTLQEAVRNILLNQNH